MVEIMRDFDKLNYGKVVSVEKTDKQLTTKL